MKNRIRKFMKKRKISYRDLANLTAITPSYLCKLVNHRFDNITLRQLKNIADALEVKISDLIVEEERELKPDLDELETKSEAQGSVSSGYNLY